MVKQYPRDTPKSAAPLGIPTISMSRQAKKLRAKVPSSASQMLYRKRTVAWCAFGISAGMDLYSHHKDSSNVSIGGKSQLSTKCLNGGVC